VQRDGNELGELVVDYERRGWHGEPHNQLQRCRELGQRGPICNRHGGFGNVCGDAERVVHVYRHTHQSEFCPLGGDWNRHGDDVGRLLMDRFAIGIVDHDHQRVIWKRKRICPVSDIRLYRFVFS
jgi:hypothetical protein